MTTAQEQAMELVRNMTPQEIQELSMYMLDEIKLKLQRAELTQKLHNMKLNRVLPNRHRRDRIH